MEESLLRVENHLMSSIIFFLFTRDEFDARAR